MRDLSTFALIFSLLSTLAFCGPSASAEGVDCALYSIVSPTSMAPKLGRVTGSGRIPILPDNAPAGRTGPYLVEGDLVVVLATAGARTCVAFTAPNRAARETVGWIATQSVSPSETGSAQSSDWIGEWHSGPEQEVTFAPAGKSFSVTGDATYGATDPVRVARGGVNIGSLKGLVTLAAGQADYADGPTADDCHVRFWQLGPYLVAADNRVCGGMSVSFTGVYRRVNDRSK
jgi:hypothetical protein